MKFSATRKAATAISSKKIQADYLGMIGSLEKVSGKDKAAGGVLATRLIGTTLAMQKTLDAKQRGKLVTTLFDESTKLGIDHQWERKPEYECGPNDDCGKPSPKKTCFRDTSVPGSCFTLPNEVLSKK